MPRLQELIHALEVGAGARYLRILALLLAMVGLAVAYDVREYQNLRNEEAMDSAQVARNLAEGRGFTTRYLRPLSLGVMMRHRGDRSAQIKEEHPDLANAPLYPAVLAGFMKIPGLFNHEMVSPREGLFLRHQPDLLITVINQGFLFLTLGLTWRLARRLFDDRVAMLTVLVMLGSELLWRFSNSGLSTMMAMALLMALANVVHALDAGTQAEPPMGVGRQVLLAAGAGLMCALLFLTRYSLGVVVIPLLVYLIASFPGRRVVLPLVAGVMFVGAATPWVVRNVQVCGNPFGLAPYSLVQETSHFTENWLDRTLDPVVTKVTRTDVLRKVFVGADRLLREELPQIGGTWLSAFFLVGLLVPFVQPVRGRLRWLTVGWLVVLGVAQVLARTHLSDDTPRVNSENLLVLLMPLVLMFGASLLSLLVYSLDVRTEAWRKVILGAAVTLFWLPLVVMFGPPRTSPIAWPPYYPPNIQGVASWFKEDELIMTDMPWAVAWYGNRQAVLLSRYPDRDFLEISDWQKTVNGLYLTRLSLDQRFLTDWVFNGAEWGRFIINILTKAEVPKGFPLQRSPAFLETFPAYLLLTDHTNRWSGGTVRVPKQLQAKDKNAEAVTGPGAEGARIEQAAP